MSLFPFGSATPGATSFLAASTPVNQNRTTSGFLLNSTQPSALSSTPFASSTSLFGASTPAPTTGSTGTIHKFDAVISTDKINKNGIQTQIRTKLFNICAMPVYEKKSTEELRLEDYVDNRKFPSTITTTGTSLFPSASSTTPLFGGTTTATNPTTSASTFGSSLFGNRPATSTAPSFAFGSTPAATPATTATATATPSLFSFGGATTATTAAAAPFSFGGGTTTTAASATPFGSTVPATAPITSTSPFTFGSSQPSAVTTAAAPTFSFGGNSGPSFFSTATTSTTPAATSFGFPVAKPTTAPTFSFTPPTATSTAASSFGFFPASTTTATTAPTLYTTTNQPNLITTQSSVDTKTHLQLFQTMLNIQPFNSELSFLARNIKPNIGIDRARLRTAPDSTSVLSINNVFSPLLTKPSVLPSSTTTPPSTLVHPLPTHSHTLPSVLLPSSATSTSIGLFGKRKLADSFLDDDDDNSLMMDDGPSSINKIPRTNLIKRPRVLDMNKIRSVVFGGGGTGTNESIPTKEEQFSDTYIVKPTSDNTSGWKKFANYDAYLASKQPQQQRQIETIKIADDDEKQININENKFEQERAFRLPRLTRDDYYTKPTIDELRHYFNNQGQCIVKEFTVGREHYGSVTFQGSKINLAGLNLDQLVEISRRQVTVYPDDNNKPLEGEELNCPAIISLVGVYPIDRSVSNSGEEVTDPDRLIDMNYGNYLRDMTKKFQGKFIDYDVYTGTWTFKVDHF